jgi:Flp pilus assembly protein TadB
MLLLIASLCLGISFGLFTGLILDFSVAENFDGKNDYDYHGKRLYVLRSENWFYRFAEKFIIELSKFQKPSANMKKTVRALALNDPKKLWMPEIYIAYMQTEGIFAFAVFVMFGIIAGVLANVSWGEHMFFTAPIVGVISGMAFGYFMYSNEISEYCKNADEIREKVKYRLPHTVDMIALLQNAGASFEESIETTINDNKEQPISQILAEVLRQTEHGVSMRQSLENARQQVDEATFNDLIVSINRSEELGTPLAQTLLSMTDQLRLKQQQMGEKIAGEAEVKIIFPTMIIMCSCLIILVTPFILPFVLQFMRGEFL